MKIYKISIVVVHASVMKHSQNCRFRRGSQIGLDAVNATDSRWTRTKRYLKQLRLASADHHQIYRYLKSHAAVRKHNKLLLERHHCVIHPLSKFREWWDILMFASLCMHLIIVPFVVAFFDEITTFNFMPISVGDTIISSLLYIEVILKFFTGYLVEQDSRIELDIREIWKHYLRGSFFLDVLGSAPYIGIMDALIPDVEIQPGLYSQTSRDKDVNIITHSTSMLYLCNIFR